MKVILISTVANLGKIGDVVQVKNGFARNFLIPNNKAIIYNDNNAKIFEDQKKHFEEESDKLIKIANSVKKSLGNQNIIITENASDDGRLYGSVTSAIIADKINKLVKEDILNRSHVILQNQIKEIGIYNILISLHPDAQFEISLIVCRNESEAESLIKAKKESDKKLKSEVEQDNESNSKKAKKTTQDKGEHNAAEINNSEIDIPQIDNQ